VRNLDVDIFEVVHPGTLDCNLVIHSLA
jgi:hypothetical protein